MKRVILELPDNVICSTDDNEVEVNLDEISLSRVLCNSVESYYEDWKIDPSKIKIISIETI